MSRAVAFTVAMFAVPCLLLAGCNWDSAVAHYDDYQTFTTSKDFKDPLMPTAVIPKSARAIDYKLVTDMNEATVDFDFAPADRAVVVDGFEAIPPAVRAGMVRGGSWFDQPDPTDTVLRRCSDERVEIIAVSAKGHAHYQSSQYPETRDPLCVGAAKSASPA